jgi:cytochrome P450
MIWRGFEIAVLGLVLVQSLRLLKPPVWRELRTGPGTLLALVLAAGAAAVVWLSLRYPLLRHGVIGVTAVWLLLTHLRSRPYHGVKRGLPPGSLGFGVSLDAITDRRFYRKQAQRFGPVFKMSQFGRPVACIIGFDRARGLLVDLSDHLSGATLPYNRLVPKGSWRYMARADHRDVAPVFRAAFAGIDLAGCEDEVRDAFRERLRYLSRCSLARPGVGAHARDHFNRMLLLALARILLGLETNREEIDRIAERVPQLELGRGGGPLWRWRVESGIAGVGAVLNERQVAGDRPAPGSALAVILASKPEFFEEPILLKNLVLIFRIALGDLTGLFDWIFKQLSDNRDWVDRMRRQDAESTDLAARIVKETLRLEQSEFLYRKVVAPIQVDGFTIPAGWLLRVCVQESHRRDDIFENPDTFDPDRFRRTDYSWKAYSPFGLDSHACMGVPITHFVGRLFVEELATRYDWTVVQDGPLERGNRHRQHWRPARSLRATLRPVA